MPITSTVWANFQPSICTSISSKDLKWFVYQKDKDGGMYIVQQKIAPGARCQHEIENRAPDSSFQSERSYFFIALTHGLVIHAGCLLPHKL